MALTKITPQMFDTSAAGHDFNIDNGTFVVDASANRVGIGTATPSTLLHVNGALTTGSVAIDNITIDGNEIDASSGHIVLDSADEIKLDAHSGIIRVQTQGGDIGMIRALNSDLQIRSMVADKDIVFHGDDGGSGVTALTLDMSEGGRAIFAAPVLTSAGSASAPSLSFSGDSNTGLYSVAADNIGFAIAGSARAFLSATQFNMTGNVVASGNVIVGNSNLGSNTSHLANLTINNNAYIGSAGATTAIQIATAGGVTFASSVKLSGQTSSDGLRLDLAGSTDYKIGETSTNDIVSFGAAGGAATHLIHHNISSGKVGIGIVDAATTLNISSGSDALLTIQNSTYQGSGQNTESALRFKSTAGTDDERAKAGILFKNDGSAYGRGDLHFLVDSTEDNGNAVLADSKMVITHEGNVGIGHTAPAYGVSVHKEGDHIQLTTNNSGAAAGNGTDLKVNSSSADFQILNYETAAISLWTAGTQRLTISSTGEVITQVNGAIGSSSSAGSLTISGGATNKGGQILLRGGNGDSDIVFKAQASTATPTERVRINSTGLIIKDSSLEFDKPSVYGFRFLHNDNGNDLSLQIGDANNANYRTLANFDTNGINVNYLNQDSNMARLRLGRNVQNDSYVYFNTIAQDWSIGVDYSDSSKFKLSRYSSPGGGNNIFEIGTGGDMAYYVHLTPATTNTYDLGTSTVRWRNIFSQDLHLSNEDTGGNDVDGTEGNWTIQEGEEHLYIINNKTGKKFRFALEEIT